MAAVPQSHARPSASCHLAAWAALGSMLSPAVSTGCSFYPKLFLMFLRENSKGVGQAAAVGSALIWGGYDCSSRWSCRETLGTRHCHGPCSVPRGGPSTYTEPLSHPEGRKTEFQQSCLLLPPPGELLLHFLHCFLSDYQALNHTGVVHRAGSDKFETQSQKDQKRKAKISMEKEELAVAQEACLLHCAMHTGYVTAKAALWEHSLACFMVLDIPWIFCN